MKEPRLTDDQLSKMLTDLEEDDAAEFGITFPEEGEQEAEAEVDPAILLQYKLDTIMSLIRPLLSNLTRSPEKETILWPNRAEKVREFLAKLEEINNLEKLPD